MNIPEKVISINDVDESIKENIRKTLAMAFARNLAEKAIKQALSEDKNIDWYESGLHN